MEYQVGSDQSAIAEVALQEYAEQNRLFTAYNERINRLFNELGVKPGDTIKLSDGRVIDAIDNFEFENVQWRPAPVRRFDLKVPKKPK